MQKTFFPFRHGIIDELRADLKCALLAVSAMALLVLWGSHHSIAPITVIIWICFWKTIKQNIPPIRRTDIGYIAFSIALCAVSCILFCKSHPSGFGSINTNIPVVFFGIAGAIVAVPFVASFTKFFITSLGNESSDCSQYPSSRFSKVLFLIAGVGMLSMMVMSFSRDIWMDESFSLNLIKHGYADLISLTAIDVHPPLYYIILKGVVDLVHAVLPCVQTIFIAKLVSVIPYVILLVVIVTKVRRDFGIYVASLAALCMMSMSRQLEYGVEIRMYSWGMCFATLAFLQIRDIINGQHGRSWTLFVVFSLFAAYTHYYALVAVGLLYLALLVWLCMREKKQVWKWAVATVATAVGYLPWLIVLIQQLQTVTESYWISAVVLRWYVLFVLTNPFLLLVIALLLYALIRKKRLDKDEFFAGVGTVMPFGIIIVGVAVSLIVRPFIIPRYIFPGLGCMWIGLSVLIGKTGTRATKTVTGMIMVLICVANIAGFTYNETKSLFAANRTWTFLRTHKDCTFLSNDAHCTCVTATLSGGECFNWGKGPYNEITREVTQKVYDGKVSAIYDARDIAAWIDNGETVFALIKSEKDDGAIIEEILRDSGLGYTLVDNLRISGGDAKVYKIEKTSYCSEL